MHKESRAGRRAIHANIDIKKLLVKLLQSALEPSGHVRTPKPRELILCSIPSAVWMLREPISVPVPSISSQTCTLPELHVTASQMTIVVQGPGENCRILSGSCFKIFRLHGCHVVACRLFFAACTPAISEEDMASTCPQRHQIWYEESGVVSKTMLKSISSFASRQTLMQEGSFTTRAYARTFLCEFNSRLHVL